MCSRGRLRSSVCWSCICLVTCGLRRGVGASEAAFTQLIFIEGSEAAAGELRSAIERHKQLIMGTPRRDGSPRLSGTEVTIGFGELWLGMMPNGVKGRDLRRDLRFALHSAPLDVTIADGDATLSGVGG
jgi:hypothetical protein